MRFTHRALIGLASLGLLAATSPVRAQTMYYGGDLDGKFMFPTYSSDAPSFRDLRYFDNFRVGATGWNVTGVFGNFLAWGDWNTAEYQIRTGVSSTSLGTVVFSGSAFASRNATGRTAFGLSEYRAGISGLSFFLGAGDYWLSVVPGVPGILQAYTETTSGAGSVNALGDNFGYQESADDQMSSYRHDLSYGLEGTIPGIEVDPPVIETTLIDEPTTTVPEPSTWVLMASGLAGLAAIAKRRKAQD